MKPMMSAFVSLGLLLACQCQATAADVVFYANGDFEEGLKLTGTVTIDTATGTVVSANLKIYYGSSEAAYFDKSPLLYDYGSYLAIEVGGVWIKKAQLASISLQLTTKSLVGYTGGVFHGDIPLDGYSANYGVGFLEP